MTFTPRTIICHVTAATCDATDTTEFNKAVGYLSTWNMVHPTMHIYADGETDMTAVYFDADGNRAYVIGAVWHEDHYGFHS
jgi:hypothetical protein